MQLIAQNYRLLCFFFYLSASRTHTHARENARTRVRLKADLVAVYALLSQ